MRTATWTPIPTLLPEARQEKVADLLSSNGGCDLPCWWGIRQGDPIEKAAAITSPFGSVDVRGRTYGYSLPLAEDTGLRPLDITFHTTADVNIERMAVELLQPTAYLQLRDMLEDRFAPERILTRYGQPSEILFAAAPLAEPAPFRSYVVFLIYEELDFGIAYHGLTSIDDPVRICSIDFRNLNPVVESLDQISLYLYDPMQELDRLNREYFNDLHTIADVTTMSVAAFTEAFSNPDSGACIESDVTLWQ